MLRFIISGGWVMFVLLALAIPLLVAAGKFAKNASPQGLSVIRTLSAAMIFMAIAGVTSDLATVGSKVSDNPEWLKEPLPYLLGGFAESMTPAIVASGLLSVAWMLVAFGVRRMPK
ncbi:MAG TPA: hypothetical protein VGG28_06350 [Kofleriaceae bacterium]|jgi:hypothetical protein